MLDLSKPSFLIATASILFNPIFWNIVARNEYHNKTLTRIFGAKYGCYLLAVTIFSLGIFRDYLYHLALQDQDVKPIYSLEILGGVLFVIGNVLVTTSMYRLGVTGTYLGDYFGILMKERVTGFPFNVTGSPMYDGSTLVFLGTACWYGSIAGLVLSGIVYTCYQVALQFEDPYTANIYSNSGKSEDLESTTATPTKRSSRIAARKTRITKRD